MARKNINIVLGVNTVTFQRLAYDHEGTPSVADEKTVDATQLAGMEFQNGEHTVNLAAYGLSQLLQDRTSSVSGDEKFEAYDKVLEALESGVWKVKREGSGSGERKAQIDPMFAAGFAAFLASKGKDVSATAAVTLLQSMETEQRKALRTHPDVKHYIDLAKQEAAEQAADISLDDLLG